MFIVTQAFRTSVQQLDENLRFKKFPFLWFYCLALAILYNVYRKVSIFSTVLRIYFLLFLLNSTLAYAQAPSSIPASERAVLTSLYTATNGASWINNTNWNSSVGTECTWYGIICDSVNAHVIQIDLFNNNLVGVLPVFNTLAALREINVYGNKLSGQIPSLNGLSALIFFEVGNNQLTGSIPSLNGLINLQAFRVSNNFLTGSVPLAPSTLNAYGNKVVGDSKLCGNSLVSSGNNAIDSAWVAAAGNWFNCQSVPSIVLTTPGAPSIISVVPDNAQATIVFAASASNGGTDISGYTVNSFPAGGTDSNAGSTDLIHHVTGLTNGVSYTFTVTASNLVGQGNPSLASSPVIPVTTPGAPSIVSVTPGNGRATVKFNAPVSNGGTAITGYVVSSIPSDGADVTVNPLATSHLVLGLVNGTSYTFTVNASNSVGAGSDSLPSSPIIPATVPGVPTGISAIPGITSATVNFTAASSNGGSAITGYTVTSSPGGLTATSISPPILIKGLVSGLSYKFTVHATNAIGNSAESVDSNAVTPLQTLTVMGPVITGGFGHSVALKPDGTLWAWGHNFYGQLGNGTTNDVSVPESIGSSYAAVAAGDNHTLGLTADGGLWTWGANSSGQLGDGSQNVALKPQQIDSGYKIVAAGSLHSLAIKLNGDLYAWGANNYGQLGNGNASSTPSPVFVGANFIQVSAGISHTLGLKDDGSLYAWGANDHGQLGDGSTTARNAPGAPIDTNYLAISAAGYHSIGLKKDGTLWTWGSNSNGELGNNSVGDVNKPTQITPGTLYRAIAAGFNHNLALDTNHNLWTWGANDKGQFGNGSTTSSWVPIQIGTSGDFSYISAGTEYTVALKNDGSVWAMGANWFGQIGDGTLAHRQNTTLVSNETASGPLNLTGATQNISPDKLPPYWLEITKAANVSASITYNPADINQTGNVYVVAYLDPNSKLLTGTALPAGMVHASTITRSGTTLVAAVLTRGGWKQSAGGVATDSYHGNTVTLNSSNSNISVYDTTKFDLTKDVGIFCVAYAAGSAKGLMRSVVTGVGVSQNDCPPLQAANPADTQAPSIPLNVTAAAAGASQANLSWTGSADNVAVTTYNIYRGGTLIATLGNVMGYSDSTVAAGTTYSYSVMACDAALNCSAKSAAASVTIPAVSQSSFTVSASAGVNGSIAPASQLVASGKTANLTVTPNAGYTAVVSGCSGSLSGGIYTTGAILANCPISATFVVIPANQLSLIVGWNLLGNSVEAALDVNATFNDGNKVATVWKWIAATSKWAFYAPPANLADLAGYALSKGYDVLGTVNGGEGFWVNAKLAFTAPLPTGATVQSVSFAPAKANPVTAGGAHALLHNWSLVATGDSPTPASFDAAIATTLSMQPAAGNVYANLTTLWAWDAVHSNWYFWAPSLVNSGGLSGYIANKNYLDFSTMPNGALSPTTGFWVNMPP